MQSFVRALHARMRTCAIAGWRWRAGVMGDEGKLTRIMKRAGVGRVELDAVGAGDIASVAGMPTAGIADTVAAFAAKEGLDPGTIEPPTMRCGPNM